MDETTLSALIALHRGLERQGPGDTAFTRKMLAELPPPPAGARIADLGCGSGASALVLAEHFGGGVTAVDSCPEFLADLRVRAEARGLAGAVRAVEGDMGNLDWPAGSVDLIWSEGAAYNLTFAGALETWRPLLAPGGCAAVSELSWFSAEPPAPLREYWEAAYPAVADEAENAARARRAGFKVLGTHRLPREAWLDGYYGPLLGRIETLRHGADGAMRRVIAETEAEIGWYRRYGGHYGYTFFLLRAD